MALTNILTSSLLLLTSLSSIPLAQGAVTQYDITGLGQIWVLESDDWRTGNPNQKVGCLSDSGRFINPEDDSECGTFRKLTDYPYTMHSKEGNCTFYDETKERNTDSIYGSQDHAWSCDASLYADVYDGLYTIVSSSSILLIALLDCMLTLLAPQDGFNYPFLCWGDIACFYDVKHKPKKNKNKEDAPLWQYRWGSQQRGIPPGHTMIQLLWHRVGDAKREGEQAPGPRIEIKEGVQAPLQGKAVGEL